MSQETYKALRTAILNGDDVEAAAIGQKLLEEPSSLLRAVDEAIDSIRHVGDMFGEGEIYLPEMILAAEAMQAFMKVATPHMEKSAATARTTGKIVMGTVKGDIHTIGKDITAMMLSVSGFEVHDSGVDVAPMDMITTAEQAGAQIIGLSALMTTSMPYQKEVISLLNALNARDKFYVIVGGGPLTAEYAQSIGANGWARNAAGAVRVCERLLRAAEPPSTAQFVAEER